MRSQTQLLEEVEEVEDQGEDIVVRVGGGEHWGWVKGLGWDGMGGGC